MRKERPMLFSTPMVKAILDGSKTMTRRVIKYKKVISNPQIGFSMFTEKGEFSVRGIHKDGNYGESFFKKPYEKGDILWVRETFEKTKTGYRYKANDVSSIAINAWKPSIHMPKAACRIWLEITNVRVERLQDITNEDAKREGANDWLKADELEVLKGLGDWKIPSPFGMHQFGFLSIWCKINGCENWLANPWVWVIGFKRIEKPL